MLNTTLIRATSKITLEMFDIDKFSTIYLISYSPKNSNILSVDAKIQKNNKARIIRILPVKLMLTSSLSLSPQPPSRQEKKKRGRQTYSKTNRFPRRLKFDRMCDK